MRPQQIRKLRREGEATRFGQEGKSTDEAAAIAARRVCEEVVGSLLLFRRRRVHTHRGQCDEQQRWKDEIAPHADHPVQTPHLSAGEHVSGSAGRGLVKNYLPAAVPACRCLRASYTSNPAATATLSDSTGLFIGIVRRS